jgi:hypothetical protein
MSGRKDFDKFYRQELSAAMRKVDAVRKPNLLYDALSFVSAAELDLDTCIWSKRPDGRRYVAGL